MTKETKYIKVCDRRKKLFGIKIEGHKDWYVAPVFEQLGIGEWAIGGYMKFNGKGCCFEASAYGYEPDYWDERVLTGDDGQSWDECIHYPAYQDEYFTMPFHHLYCDCFDYSFEDICNINDFRVNVNVRLITKEQD